MRWDVFAASHRRRNNDLLGGGGGGGGGTLWGCVCVIHMTFGFKNRA